MEKLKLSLCCILAIVAISFVSCSKDKSDKPNQIVYEGSNFDLATGHLYYAGQANLNPVSYYYSLSIISSEVTTDHTSFPPVYSNVGDGVWFELYSSSSTELTSGTYSYDADDLGLANTFSAGNLLLDFNFANFKTTVEARVSAGTLIIGKSGDEYELSFDCTLSNGKSFTAYFKGNMQFHDYSGIFLK